MYHRPVLALLFLLSVPASAAPAQPSAMEKAFAGLQAAKSVEELAAPLAYVLAHSQDAQAPHLFVASVAAMQTGALQDAAFLFYAAQLRARFDLARFPPKGTGGDSPSVVLAALREQIGATINPAIMRDPKAFAAVVARVSAWSPATPAAYDPSWEYTAVDEKAGKKELDERRASFVKQFGALSTLLNDAEYFAAFKTLQDFNLGGQPHDAAHVKAKDAAEATMLSIEKKRNIEGIYYHPSQH